MNDVVLCCADIPAGDKEAIVGAVLALGGQYTGSLSRAVTHLVALTLDTEKSATAVKKGLACKIVLPHWYVYPIVQYMRNRYIGTKYGEINQKMTEIAREFSAWN